MPMPMPLAPLLDSRLVGAIHAGDLDAALAALDAGADPRLFCDDEYGPAHDALMIACSLDRRDIAELLLTRGADALARSPAGHTALMAAAFSKSASCFDLILPLSDVAARDNTGLTALMDAAKCGWPHGVSALLGGMSPAEVGFKTFGARRRSAVDLARDAGHPAIVRLVESHGAMLDQAALNEATPAGTFVRPPPRM